MTPRWASWGSGRPDRNDFLYECRTLFQQYWSLRRRQEAVTNVDWQLFAEGETRLEQLDYLIERIKILDSREDEPSLDESGFFIRLHAECFYYIAARLEALCRKNEGLGLRDYKCRKIAIVRNHLVEHPETYGLHSQNWSWNHEDGRGPVLKDWSAAPGQTGDEGLFRNAEELRRNLHRSLTNAITRLGGWPPRSEPLNR